jgi:hypothetical protein
VPVIGVLPMSVGSYQGPRTECTVHQSGNWSDPLFATVATLLFVPVVFSTSMAPAKSIRPQCGVKLLVKYC